MAKNEIAVIDSTNQLALAPSKEDMQFIMEELADMDRLPYGTVKIAAGGANVYQVFEPGEEEPDTQKDFEGVIIMSHKSNGYWPNAFSGENSAPDCYSNDGVTGTIAATGECRNCEDCPLNQYGSAVGQNGNAGRGKACKNMRRLYIMRRGDILPMVMTLPPTALGAYDKYRTKIMMSRKKMMAVMTKFTLKTEKNGDGIKYSVPVFDAVGSLNPSEAAAVAAYAASFQASAVRVAVSAEDAGSATAKFTPTDEAFPEPPAEVVCEQAQMSDADFCPIE